MRPNIDENLLQKMVVKYGLDREQNAKHRTRLWDKLTKDYNRTTDGSFAKAKFVKKWQNVQFRDKNKTSKSASSKKDSTDNLSGNDRLSPATKDEIASDEKTAEVTLRPYRDNLWSVMDFALRDLFLYLIMKHGLEDITHPRVKSRVWQELCVEFHTLIGNCVMVKQEKFPKKWQNWKAYNKNKGMPHPFEQCKDRLDFDVIRAKLMNLRDKVAHDKKFAANLSQEGDVLLPFDEKLITSGEIPDTVAFCAELFDDMESTSVLHAAAVPAHNFESDSTKPVSSSTSTVTSSRPFDKQIAMKRLRNESAKLRFIVENGRLEQRKLELEINLASVQLEQAKIDLALKQQELASLGLVLQK